MDHPLHGKIRYSYDSAAVDIVAQLHVPSISSHRSVAEAHKRIVVARPGMGRSRGVSGNASPLRTIRINTC